MNNPTLTHLLVLAAMLPIPPARSAEPAEAPTPRRVLLVTGIDYPGHPWRQTAPAIRQLLEQDPRLRVTIIEDPHFLDSPAAAGFDMILLHFMNWEQPSPGKSARDNLQRLVQHGTGLMLVHFACGAWQDWPEFKDLAGRVWDPNLRAHDPRGPFKVDIADPDHPITRGLDSFETDDELYTCLTGDLEVHVIASAKSKVDGIHYPMAFVFNQGQGRVFHTVLGHDLRAITNSTVPELLRRGCAWAAGLPPQP